MIRCLATDATDSSSSLRLSSSNREKLDDSFILFFVFIVLFSAAFFRRYRNDCDVGTCSLFNDDGCMSKKNFIIVLCVSNAKKVSSRTNLTTCMAFAKEGLSIRRFL